MGRLILSAAIAGLFLLPNPGEAQTPGGAGATARPTPRGSSFGVTIKQDPAPRASPGRPGPPAPVGPLVPQAPPSALDTVDIFQARPRTYAPRYDRVPRQRFPGGYGAGYGYITDPFGYISQPSTRHDRPTTAIRVTGTESVICASMSSPRRRAST